MIPTVSLLAAIALLLYCWPRSSEDVIDRYYQQDQQHYVRWQAYRALERRINLDAESPGTTQGAPLPPPLPSPVTLPAVIPSAAPAAIPCSRRTRGSGAIGFVICSAASRWA